MYDHHPKLANCGHYEFFSSNTNNFTRTLQYLVAMQKIQISVINWIIFPKGRSVKWTAVTRTKGTRYIVKR